MRPIASDLDIHSGPIAPLQPELEDAAVQVTPRDWHKPSRRWIRIALLRAVLVAGATAIALLVGELGIRVYRPQVMFPRYVTDGGFGIRVNAPNTRYWHTSPEVRAEFRINSMGIRSDREFSFDKPPGVIRVVGLGDSFTQGYEVDLKDTYLLQLEERLKAQGVPVEVINLGVSGQGNAEELIMLKEFGFRFDPDVVILGYYQNDLADNVRCDLYRLDDKERLVRASAAYLPAVGLRDKLYSFWVYRWLSEHSQLLSLVRERLAALIKYKLADAKNGMSNPEGDDRYPARLAAALLDEIKRECDERGVEFLLLDIPEDPAWKSNLPRMLLQRVRPDQVLDSGPRLRAEGPGAYLYRRRGHFHWTPRGHEIASDILTEALMPVLRRRQTGDPAGD